MQCDYCSLSLTFLLPGTRYESSVCLDGLCSKRAADKVNLIILHINKINIYIYIWGPVNCPGVRNARFQTAGDKKTPPPPPPPPPSRLRAAGGHTYYNGLDSDLKKNKKNECKKWLPLSSDDAAHVQAVHMLARLWCTVAKDYNRQRHHMTCPESRCVELVPAAEVLELRRIDEEPVGRVLNDDELDLLDAAAQVEPVPKAKGRGKRGQRGKGKGKGKAADAHPPDQSLLEFAGVAPAQAAAYRVGPESDAASSGSGDSSSSSGSSSGSSSSDAS